MSTAKDVMTTELITVAENTPIHRAMRLLIEHNITGLPVVGEDMYLLGIVSEKDMLEVLYASHLNNGLVMDIMTTDLVCFEEDDDLIDIAEAMIQGHFRRVPILRGDTIVGIVTRRDILEHILKSRVGA